MQCPACNSKQISVAKHGAQVHQCRRCNAIFGDCYLGDSYALVKPWWAEGDVPNEDLRYFDLECLGSAGITRRHGWFDVNSRRIVQVG